MTIINDAAIIHILIEIVFNDLFKNAMHREIMYNNRAINRVYMYNSVTRDETSSILQYPSIIELNFMFNRIFQVYTKSFMEHRQFQPKITYKNHQSK